MEPVDIAVGIITVSAVIISVVVWFVRRKKHKGCKGCTQCDFCDACDPDMR